MRQCIFLLFVTKNKSEKGDYAMNLYFKKAYPTILSLIILFVVSGFLLTRNSYAPSDENIYPESSAGALPKEASVNESGRYYLTASSGKIYAYRVRGDSKELINSGDINLMLMTDEEIKKLSDGIYAESFEEL